MQKEDHRRIRSYGANGESEDHVQLHENGFTSITSTSRLKGDHLMHNVHEEPN